MTPLLYRFTNTGIIEIQLQVHINDLKEWCTKWRIKINPNTSAVALIEFFH